jgi:arylsulfatase A-like enzyme
MGHLRIAKKIIIAVCTVAVVLAVLLALIIPKHKHPRVEKRYSVLLITLDSVTARYLSSYGYERKTTPNLDQFAHEHVRFTQAFGQTTFTGPAHASLLTSLYPRTHGVFDNGISMEKGTLTLARVLQENGYRTAAVVNTGLLGRDLNFDQGFDSFVVVGGHPENQEAGKDYDSLFGVAEKWISDNRTNDFFCWIQCDYTHSPYEPGKRFRNIWYSENDLKKMNIKTRYNQALNLNEAVYEGTLTEDEVAYAKSQYDGDLVQTDEVVRKFLDRVEKLVPLDRLIVVIIGDHGEMFDLKNKRFGHNYILYEDVVHVPLVMSVPAVQGKRFQNMVINETVQGIDVAPTVLDLVGIPIPAAFQGVSFADFFRTGPKPLHSALVLGVGTMDEVACIRKDNWKLIIEYNEGRELYNLAVDPHEDRNLVISEEGETEKLLALYKQWAKFVPNCYVEKLRTKPGDLSPEILEILKASGYVVEKKNPGR